MFPKRLNLRSIKSSRCYDVPELALLLGVHKNTIRNWQRAGLKPIDGNRPTLFHGGEVRSFLERRKASAKAPCPPGTLYCLRCRAPRSPVPGSAEFLPGKSSTGNIRARCEVCDAHMHRRARQERLTAILPDRPVQTREAQ
jgi:hypothetical protein